MAAVTVKLSKEEVLEAIKLHVQAAAGVYGECTVVSVSLDGAEVNVTPRPPSHSLYKLQARGASPGFSGITTPMLAQTQSRTEPTKTN